MKNNKFYLPILIVLLVLFVPVTVVLTYTRILDKTKEANPNHLPFFEGSLYFYDNNNKLIGSYKCETDDCRVATGVENDTFDFYDYKSDVITPNKQNSVLIKDGNNYKFYSFTTNTSMITFLLVKNYNAATGYIIVKDRNNKEGILDYQNVQFVIPAEYYYIGLNSFDAINYIVSDENSWFLIDIYGNKTSSDFLYQIVSYDGKFIYAYNDEKYHLYSYAGKEYLTQESIDNVDKVGNYIVIESKGNVKIYNETFTLIKSFGEYGKNYSFKINENMIEIYNQDNLLNTIDPNDLGDA